MRIAELSNHPGELLEEHRSRHAQAERQQMAGYELAVADHRARAEEVRGARAKARAERRWFTWLRKSLALWGLQGVTPRRPPSVPVDVREEAKLTAGLHGEQAVAAGLAGALGDEWALFCGYRNRRGEIDQLLIGPGGVFAIEIKFRNATVHCDGDSWWFEKFDRYGNRVGEGQIVDRRGRSPSLQLIEPARALEEFLARRGQPVAVRPIVLLTHPRSRLGSMLNLTVDVATDVGYVLQVATAEPQTLDPARRAAIERLIVRDHAFHENPRGQPARVSG